jgi:predicted membrane-bound spermidine synthase
VSPFQRSRLLAASLALASFAVLLQELALIRWLPSAVRVLAYFPNLILISAFLGLGLGCLRAGRRSLLWLWPVSLLALAGAALALGRIAFTQESESEHLWLLYADLSSRAPVVSGLRAPILLMFILSTLTFLAPGQIVAERLEEFRRGGDALRGYCWDLIGSLLGTAAFAAACFSWTGPVLWFSLVTAAAFVFFLRRPRLRLLYLGCAAALLFLVNHAEQGRYRWSPYYALDLWSAQLFAPFSGVAVTANGSVHQYALDLGSNAPRGSEIDEIRRGYRLPYRRLQRKPRHVLVLGAGSGNDVAVALAEGADRVDAVEIDPAIVEIGRSLHPNRPYASPKVRAFVTDARSFLENSRDRYDLIVFGTLDSMTRLSALSSVRLDNFVYTVESLRAARDHLTDDGGLVLYFMVGTRHIHERLLAALVAVFEAPTFVAEFSHVFNTIYLAGPAFPTAHPAAVRELLVAEVAGREPATDDWPYLYLAARGISPFYFSLMAAIAFLALLGVAVASPDLRKSAFSGRFDGEMFLLGLAFLLLETRAVTEMTLVWGVSWLTSAVVFGAILLMALLGTLARVFRPLPWGVSLVLLGVFLLVSYLVPTAALLTPSPWPRLLLSVAFVGPPVFFAATLFAAIFQERESAGVAFGWNLLGAVAGGLLEFTSMAVGIKAMHLLALAAYLCAGLVRSRTASSRLPATSP